MFSGNLCGVILLTLFIIETNCTAVHKRCSKSCLNDGFCLEINAKSRCYCLPEWQGEYCEQPREAPTTYTFITKNQLLRNTDPSDLCGYVPNLCQGRGACYVNETANTLSCQCVYPYAGSRCADYSG